MFKSSESTYMFEKQHLNCKNDEFEKDLLDMANKMGLTLYTNVKLNELIKPTKSNTQFGIKRKFNEMAQTNFDFVLCDDTDPLLVIEIGDKKIKGKNGTFIKHALLSADIHFISEKNLDKLEEKISGYLGLFNNAKNMFSNASL